MIKDVYKINTEKIYEDMYKINTENNTYYNGSEWLEIDFEYVEAKPPHAKVVRWDGSKWIVIEEYPIEPIEPQPPTPEERLTAVEEALLLLLMEV
jgi:hypothetical protein